MSRAISGSPIRIATAIHQKAETFITNDEHLARVNEIKVTIPRRKH